MSKVMYCACWILKDIKKVDVEKETKDFITLAGSKSRQSKLSEKYQAFFESFGDAKSWLESELMDDINTLQSRLEGKKEELEKVNLLTE